MHCRSLLLTTSRHLEWVTEDIPPLQADEVLIQTHMGAISIGTELPQYCGTARSSKSPHYPKMTGYESIGTVIACGSQVQRLRIGDRVVAFYGHRTYAVVPEMKAILVPEGVTDAIALLTILSCDVNKGIRKVLSAGSDTVLITGAGTIGLLTVFMLKVLGTSHVDVVEPLAERQELALRLGANSAVSPQEMQESETYVVGMECSSRNAAFELLQDKIQHNGRICILSDGNVEALTLTPAFHEKELSVVGSSDGENYQGHARWFFDIVKGQTDKLEQLFDYHTTMDELIGTFENIAQGEISPIKVLVKYY